MDNEMAEQYALLELPELPPDEEGPASGFKEKVLALILAHNWSPQSLLPILEILKDIPGLDTAQVGRTTNYPSRGEKL